jgi:APA family basic amino acid/polyamine antiporter
MNGWYEKLTRKTSATPPGSLTRHPHFGWVALTALGIGAIIGAGIFSMPGTIAAIAGPAGILSFAITGVLMLAVARCYHAFSERLPNGVSAYSYVYHSLGEIFAVVVGVGLFVEYFFGTSAVAQAWSEYLFVATGFKLPAFWQGPTVLADGSIQFGINIVAVAVVAVITAILVMGGIKKSAWLNTVLVLLKMTLLATFVVVGLKHFHLNNLFPFMPFGISGVLAGAALAVFPYVGFDQLYSFVLESKREKDTSIATYLSVLLSGALYICVMLVMVGAVAPLVPNAAGTLGANPLYAGSEAAAALAKVLTSVGEGTTAQFIGIAAVIGLFNVLLVGCMAAPRVFKNMAEDGLIPSVFARTHNGNPIVGTVITGTICAILAGVVPFEKLAHMMVLGTLVAFVAVGIGAKKEKLIGWFTAILTVVGCGLLITKLDPLVFWIYPVTLAVALVVYLVYGYRNSKLGQKNGSETGNCSNADKNEK